MSATTQAETLCGTLAPLRAVNPTVSPANVGKCRATVLAGVHAWGGDPLDNILCRPLLPVIMRPLIEYTVDWLHSHGVPDIVICANSNTRAVREEFQRAGRVREVLTYFEDHLPRGPAGCVHDAAANSSALMIAVEGTVIPRFDLAKMVEHHVEANADLTVAVAPTSSYGKRASVLRPVGIYVISPAAVRIIAPKGYQDIKEGLVPRLREKGAKVRSFPVLADDVLHVADTRSYLSANHCLAARRIEGGPVPDGYIESGGVMIHTSASVHESARLIGPVIIGPKSDVSQGALVLGPAILGEGSRLQRDSVVAGSVLWNRVVIGRGATVDGCVATDEASVPHESWLRHRVIRADSCRGTRWRWLCSLIG